VPVNAGQDADKYLAGRKDKWEVEDIEIFAIDQPSSKPRHLVEEKASVLERAQVKTKQRFKLIEVKHNLAVIK